MTAVPTEPPREQPEPVGAARIDYEKARYAARVDDWHSARTAERTTAEAERAATAAADVAARAAAAALAATRQDAAVAEEIALRKAIQDAYIATAQSSLERALARANVVTGSVSAIATVYTGLLALVYAAKPGEGRALHLVAVVPALFLGASLFGVTVYAAFLRRRKKRIPLIPSAVGGDLAQTRLNDYLTWCADGVMSRAWALRGGVAALGVGVATLPLPFITLSSGHRYLIAGLGAAFVVLVALPWSEWFSPAPAGGSSAE